MNKNCYLFIGVMISFLLLFASCEETDGVSEYDNWQFRNESYIDSIAKVAAANPTEWTRYKPWYLSADNENSLEETPADEYIYVQVLREGEGTYSPLTTDYVSVNYRGRLINGVVFDESYSTEEPDPEFVKPYTSLVSGNIEGFQQALLRMKEGDRWMIYIPWKLGYGSAGRGSILGYTTLIFDAELYEINP